MRMALFTITLCISGNCPNDWLTENKAAISAYNKRIATHGVFSDGIRRF